MDLEREAGRARIQLMEKRQVEIVKPGFAAEAIAAHRQTVEIVCAETVVPAGGDFVTVVENHHGATEGGLRIIAEAGRFVGTVAEDRGRMPDSRSVG